MSRRGGRWSIDARTPVAPDGAGWRASWGRTFAAAAGGSIGSAWRRPIVLAGAGLVASSCAETLPEQTTSPTNLGRQQQVGWSIGDESRPLMLPGAVDVDAHASVAWKTALPELANRLAPAEPRWQPFYAPALFQSLQAPRNADLRALMRPISTPEMADAFARGQALLSLFADEQCPNDVALVLDLPGPQSVAVAAAVAPCFDPVFVFDNWPHPAGVVPSHLTLGAALYYAPTIDDARANRALSAPPAFVLDRARLTPYTDEATQFDNRYLARLPTRESLLAAGVRHVLYVTPDQTIRLESDDLNDAFVDLERGQIDVRMLALSDFQPDVDAAAALLAADVVVIPGPAYPPPLFYFGGGLGPHRAFWSTYGWQRRAVPVRGVPAIPPKAMAMTTMASLQYRPAARTTVLSRGVGIARGVGVAHASSNGATGSHRNGTFGRMGSGAGHGHGG